MGLQRQGRDLEAPVSSSDDVKLYQPPYWSSNDSANVVLGPSDRRVGLVILQAVIEAHAGQTLTQGRCQSFDVGIGRNYVGCIR